MGKLGILSWANGLSSRGVEKGFGERKLEGAREPRGGGEPPAREAGKAVEDSSSSREGAGLA